MLKLKVKDVYFIKEMYIFLNNLILKCLKVVLEKKYYIINKMISLKITTKFSYYK